MLVKVEVPSSPAQHVRDSPDLSAQAITQSTFTNADRHASVCEVADLHKWIHLDSSDFHD